MLASCDRRSTFGRRDFAVLTLLIRLGLRAGEVAALELDDIDWRAGEVTIRGKGRREERLPLPVDVGDALVGWLRRGRPRCECASRPGPECTRNCTAVDAGPATTPRRSCAAR